MATDFCIVSKPDHISFECPHCGCGVDIPFRDIDAPECWSDSWPEVACPICDQTVSLGNCDYD